jgi:Peptidase MA superfamily
MFFALWSWLAMFSPAWGQQWTAPPPEAVVHHELPTVPAEWTTVPGTYLAVHGPIDLMPVLVRVARHASEVLPDFSERLGVPIGMTIHVYVAPDDATFRALQPGRPPTWADATAWPELGAVFLRAPAARNATDPEPLEQVLRHELTHVLVGRAFAPNDPPAWLQEGAAQLLAGQIGPEDGEALTRGVATGGLIPLMGLEKRFPRDPRRAELAYAESADFLVYLMQQHGDDVLPRLIEASRGGANLSQAVYQVTGQFLEDVEADWKAQHSTWNLRLTEIAKLDWLFGLGAVGLVIAGVRRLRERKRRIEQMEDEDEPDVVDALIHRWPRPIPVDALPRLDD